VSAPLGDPFEPPAVDPGPYLETARSRPWFAVGIQKLWVMTLVTFGLYTVYWFERHFRFQRRATGEKTMPLARGIFAIFFAGDLFRRVRAAAHGAGIDVPWAADKLASTFVVLVIASRLFDRATGQITDPFAAMVTTLMVIGLGAAVAYPLAQVQATVNELLARTEPGHPQNAGFTLWNWLVIGLFALAMIAVLAGS
jgi:hypothetical protein